MVLLAESWPLRPLLLAALVVVAACICAGWHSYRALSALRGIARRKTPPRLLWAIRGLALPYGIVGGARIALLCGVAAVLGAGLTTLAMARGADPQTVVRPTTVPTSLAMGGADRKTVVNGAAQAAASTPATFVRSVVPALEHLGLTPIQAVFFAAHLARETGWGRWVRGNNFGNIKTGDWSGRSFQLTDRLGFRGTYRAYDTTEAGLRDAVALIRDSSRYRRAWRLLQAGDTRWYGQLGLDGYYEAAPEHGQHGMHTLATIGDVQREYEQIVDLVRRCAGGAMAPIAQR